MINYKLVKNKNKDNSKSYNKWYARPVSSGDIDLDALAEHMANHNSPYSKGAIKGVLTDMVSCIKEELKEGRAIKIDNLAIFSIGIRNKVGAETVEDFTTSGNIDSIKLRARPCGDVATATLNLDVTLKRSALDKKVVGEDLLAQEEEGLKIVEG
jgi:predicted histone-like DNA-binding protein